MDLRPSARRVLRAGAIVATLAWLAFFSFSCAPRPAVETRVERGNRDGIFYVGIGPEPHDLDPHTAIGVPEANILRALGEGLVNLDGRDLRPIPGVAERWDISADGLTYTFHLRADARWSDGAPLTAADFVASFRRELLPGLGADFSELLWPIRGAEAFNKGRLRDFTAVGVRAPDDRTLELTLERPTAYFLSLLAQRMFYPVRPASGSGETEPLKRGRPPRADKPGSAAEAAAAWIGNGPFAVVEWRHNQEIVLRRNPHYWNAAAVRLQAIHFCVVEDVEAEERAFRAGLLHKTARMPQSKIDTYRREHPDQLRIDPALGTYFYLLNTTRPPLDDARVRRALALALDRAALVRHVARGDQRPADAFTPPDTAGYTARTRLPFDPEAARRLLAEAGFPSGRGLPALELLFNTNENHRLLAEAVQAMWQRELGAEVRLVNQEWKVYLNSLSTGSFALARSGWSAGHLDPNAFLENFVSGGANNRTGFADPRYDALLAEAAATADPEARRELFQQAEARLLDAAPIIPIYHYTYPYLLQPSVRGWPPNVLDYHLYQEVTLGRQ